MVIIPSSDGRRGAARLCLPPLPQPCQSRLPLAVVRYAPPPPPAKRNPPPPGRSADSSLLIRDPPHLRRGGCCSRTEAQAQLEAPHGWDRTASFPGGCAPPAA